MERDLKRLHEIADGRIKVIHLIGGEPLLHPYLLQIMDMAGIYFKGVVGITTNGILLLKQPAEFWECCRRNEIAITVTAYPIRIGRQDIETIARKYGVALKYAGGEVKEMHKMPLDMTGQQDGKRSFELCAFANACINLDEGRIYTCETIPYVKYFNRHFGANLEITDRDYIDIHTAKDIDEILEFLCRPMPFCRYCNTGRPVFHIKWGVSKKDISEWV